MTLSKPHAGREVYYDLEEKAKFAPIFTKISATHTNPTSSITPINSATNAAIAFAALSTPATTTTTTTMTTTTTTTITPSTLMPTTMMPTTGDEALIAGDDCEASGAEGGGEGVGLGLNGREGGERDGCGEFANVPMTLVEEPDEDGRILFF